MEARILRLKLRSSAGWMSRLFAGLFILHALLLGFTLGANALPVRIDRFGNVLCVSVKDASHPDGTSREGHPSGTSDGCALACSLAGTGLAPPPAGASILRCVAASTAAPFVVSEAGGPPAAAAPRNSRAPPSPD